MQAVPVSTDIQLCEEQNLHDLLGASEKTALLYNISYHCLGKFPDLERIIRSNAQQSELVFSSSEALLLRCISTSDNMAKTLFPLLKVAVEAEKPVVAEKMLDQAKNWINDIIEEVNKTVQKYEKLNKDVGSAASDVIKTKKKTETERSQKSDEEKKIEANVDRFKAKANETKNNLASNQREINQAIEALNELINSIAIRNKVFLIAAVCIPLLGPLVNLAQKVINDPTDKASIDAASRRLSNLQEKRRELLQQDQQAEAGLMDWSFRLTKMNCEMGLIPKTDYLDDVQKMLSKIKDVFRDLKSFWEKIGVLVNRLEQKTFAAKPFMVELTALKEVFLKSIEDAGQAWMQFRDRCSKVMVLFCISNKDAYKFLHVNPSSLSEEAWEAEYMRLKGRLESYQAPAIEPPMQAATAPE